MRLFTWILLSCYMIAFILLGVGLVAFSLHGLPIEGALIWLQAAYFEKNLRLVSFLTGAGLVLFNLIIARLSLLRLQQRKTIAFETSGGQVTVSLSAIEDFIRRSTQDLPEVKELRSDVSAGKGRITVRTRVTLWSEARIPEATEKIQSMIRSQIQEILSGIEEPVIVRVHVAKIVHREAGHGTSRHLEEKVPTPFRGF